MRTIDKKSIYGQVLSLISKNSELVFSMNYRKSMRLMSEKIFSMLKNNEDSMFTRDFIFQLRKQKLINIEYQGDKCKITLSEKGKNVCLKFNYQDMQIKKLKVWDGQFRMIVFDIPEKFRSARDSFRIKMKNLGCVLLNNSVWIYPYPCQKEIDFIANYWKVGKYVHFAVVKDITGKEKLIKHFKL